MALLTLHDILPKFFKLNSKLASSKLTEQFVSNSSCNLCISFRIYSSNSFKASLLKMIKIIISLWILDFKVINYLEMTVGDSFFEALSLKYSRSSSPLLSRLTKRDSRITSNSVLRLSTLISMSLLANEIDSCNLCLKLSSVSEIQKVI